MKGVLEGALTLCVTETIKAKPSNPVLFLAHRLIQYAQMPPVDPVKAAAQSKPAASKAAEPSGDRPKRRTSKAWAPNQSLAQDAKTTLEHNSKLDIYSQCAALRNCSIICTIGPKVQGVEELHMLRQAGMQICRMNFSHGSYEYHGGVITNMRECLVKYPMDGRLCAIALDTKGPEIRTGMNIEEDTELTAGNTITVTTDTAKKEKQDKDTLCAPARPPHAAPHAPLHAPHAASPCRGTRCAATPPRRRRGGVCCVHVYMHGMHTHGASHTACPLPPP